MNYPLETVLLAFGLTLLAGLSTGLGGVISVAKRNPGPQFLAGSLGFSAGVMLYVSMMELVPTGIESLAKNWEQKPATWVGVGAFFAGIAVIAVIDRLVPEPMNAHCPGHWYSQFPGGFRHVCCWLGGCEGGDPGGCGHRDPQYSGGSGSGRADP